MKHCPKCRNIAGDSANFCYGDGTALIKYAACSKCDKPVGPFDKFCENCGTEVLKVEEKP
jgi:hypothetical protein